MLHMVEIGHLAAILKNGCISRMQQIQKKHLVDYLPQGCTKLNSTINFSRPQNVYGIARQGVYVLSTLIPYVSIHTVEQSKKKYIQIILI